MRVEMTPAVKEVLGFANFECAPYAHCFRAAGHDIKPRSEDEQAFVLHWLLNIALEHGDNWRVEAKRQIEEAKSAADALHGIRRPAATPRPRETEGGQDG